ncbi:hypothetical protein NAP1_06250 [Erythrobacter sp. NAP1]|uniref:hypothetical protein n=1 Tax=Erythrobacter sp. NAP1 TaxID=237727 RepID=UPI0000686C5B|nr:hypothetical protein [Erythrobacter sp. NAP1]EAQ30356.1 hypothetical protein NAP1_06250 [Erythrobacter sp. NAP1]
MIALVLPLALLQATADAPPTPPAPPPPACASEAHGGFDLWVGEWDVFPNGSDTQVANSRIERLSGGCSIRETWMPFRGSGGQSMSMLNHTTDRWEQTWVGADGKRVDFEGGVVDGAMVLTGYWDDVAGPGQDALVRMTYSKLDDGSVRQHGEASTDHGLSWQTSFDFIYRAKDQADQ